MIEQPEGRPSSLAYRQLGFDLEVAVGLVVLAIGVYGAVEKLTGCVTLWPNLQTAI